MEINDIKTKVTSPLPEAKPFKTQGFEASQQEVKDKVTLSQGKTKTKPVQAKEDPPAFEPNPADKPKKWTVLFYMDGNNNLQGLATATFRQLETVGSNENVNIVAQVSRSDKFYDKYTKDWSGARRYYVHKNPEKLDPNQEMLSWMIPPFTQNIHSPVKTDLGKVDMGKADTLQDFLKWGIKSYPAEHYMVVMMDHGAGFIGSMQDEKTGNIISNKKMAEVLDKVGQEAGKKIDMVAFDACLMAQSEVAYQLKDSAKVMIGSEENEAGAATPFAPIMKDLQEATQGGKEITPEDFAKLYIYEAATQPGAAAYTPTQSAIDLSKMDNLKQSMDKLAQVLKTTDTPKEVVREDIKKAQHYCNALAYKVYNDYKDLQDFAERLASNPAIKDPQLQKAAQEVIQAVQSAVIAEEHVGDQVKNSHGLSVYLPDNYGHDRPDVVFVPPTYQKTHHYQDTSLAQDSQWDEMLTAISKDTKFNEFLKDKLGVSEETLDKLHSAKIAVSKPVKIAAGITGYAGSYESYHAMRHAEPRKFLFLAGELVSKLGAAGGAYKAFNGAKSAIEAALADEQKGKTRKVVDGALDFATGAAVTAACLALAGAVSAGIATPAGIVAYALPMAKMVFDIYMQVKDAPKQKEGQEASKPLTVEQKLEAVNNGKVPVNTGLTVKQVLAAELSNMQPIKNPDKYQV